MSNEAEAIFSSTGSLGVSRRQYGRLYVNGTHYSSDIHEVDGNFRRLTGAMERHPRISRVVFRGLVNEDVVGHVLSGDLKRNLEVSVPVSEFTGDNSWLVYMSQNAGDRTLITPEDEMIRETGFRNERVIAPEDRIRTAVEQGFTFVDHIPEGQIDQVLGLWGDTFGWERDQIENLSRRLDRNRDVKPSARDVWFSAVTNNGEIVSLCMAERLTIPAASSKLDLVESTEWRTREDFAGRGLMTAAIVALNAQIIVDLQDSPNGVPIIYAECNYQSRSDRAGYGAGLRIPSRTEGYAAPQIPVQNVLVRDGQLVEEGKLRDFTFMYVPKRIMREQYGPAQVNTITQMIKKA